MSFIIHSSFWMQRWQKARVIRNLIFVTQHRSVTHHTDFELNVKFVCFFPNSKGFELRWIFFFFFWFVKLSSLNPLEYKVERLRKKKIKQWKLQQRDSVCLECPQQSAKILFQSENARGKSDRVSNITNITSMNAKRSFNKSFLYNVFLPVPHFSN